jgi:hypothetical protein
MARDAPTQQGPLRPAQFDAAAWLEAHGLRHNPGDGCEHCDGWTARHWSTGQFIACTDPWCKCAVAD